VRDYFACNDLGPEKADVREIPLYALKNGLPLDDPSKMNIDIQINPIPHPTSVAFVRTGD
jgi:hypothetical protein